MDFYEAIRIKALRDVLKGEDPDYILRRIYRWYSSTFYVPLTDIDDIPISHILQHYFESYFEGLSTDKRLKEASKLFEQTETAKVDKEALEDAEFLKTLQSDLEKEKEKKAAEEKNKKVQHDKAKNQNVIHRLGNSPAAGALKRFMDEADSLSPRKK